MRLFPPGEGGAGRPVRDGDPGVLLDDPGGGGRNGDPPALTGERGGLAFAAPASVDFFVCQRTMFTQLHSGSLQPSSCQMHQQRISAVSGPKFTILWGHVGEILLLNKFFPIVDTCLCCKDIAR